MRVGPWSVLNDQCLDDKYMVFTLHSKKRLITGVRAQYISYIERKRQSPVDMLI